MQFNTGAFRTVEKIKLYNKFAINSSRFFLFTELFFEESFFQIKAQLLAK